MGVACQLSSSGPGKGFPACGMLPLLEGCLMVSSRLSAQYVGNNLYKWCNRDHPLFFLKGMLKLEWRPHGQLWSGGRHLHGRDLWPLMCTYEGTASWSHRWYSWGSYCYKNYRHQNLEGLKRSYNSTLSVTEGEIEAQRGERDYLIKPKFRLEPRLAHLQPNALSPLHQCLQTCLSATTLKSYRYGSKDLYAQQVLTASKHWQFSRSRTQSFESVQHFKSCQVNVQKIYTTNLIINRNSYGHCLDQKVEHCKHSRCFPGSFLNHNPSLSPSPNGEVTSYLSSVILIFLP